ncbi:grisea protein [Phlyctema vagabunda]|uniref:Grisea protein n=1 Tax=Phlyctema vagabunda TaxID=108571 RepID=A0ABR4PDX6_9HELO
MPLINDRKYSCESCIRGHRATSCLHTDRVLTEVRKPGRPLQSCGHKLASCSCGRVAESFSMSNVMKRLEREETARSLPRYRSKTRNTKATSNPQSPSRQGKKAKVQNQSPLKSIKTGNKNEVFQLEFPSAPIQLPSIRLKPRSFDYYSPYPTESRERHSISPPGSAPSIADLLNEDPFPVHLPPIRHSYISEPKSCFDRCVSTVITHKGTIERGLFPNRVEDVTMNTHDGSCAQVRSHYIQGIQT